MLISGYLIFTKMLQPICRKAYFIFLYLLTLGLFFGLFTNLNIFTIRSKKRVASALVLKLLNLSREKNLGNRSFLF